MPVLEPSAVSTGFPASFPPSLQSQTRPASPPPAEAGVVQAFDGRLIAIDATGGTVALAAGDAVAPGDVLITVAGAGALIEFAGGATLAMVGDARAEIVAADAGHARLVAHAGAFVVAAGPGPGQGAGAVTVETGAAILTVEAGSLAFRYALDTGLTAGAGPGAVADAVRGQIVNASGVHALDPQASAFAVPAWSDPPVPMSAGEPASLPADLLLAAEAGPPADVEPAEAEDLEAGIDFETGAGAAEVGDPTFVLAQPGPAPRSLADHGFAAAPLPSPPIGDASASVAPRAAPQAQQGHAIDALFLWQRPVEMQLPPPPPAEPAPHLRGWEPAGRTWDAAGYAWVSGGDREWQGPLDPVWREIQPVEGESMAALSPGAGDHVDLEGFLGLQHNALDHLVAGTTARDGSAIRTSVRLEAGQTLVFDVLFDAADMLPNNDYGAFTVARDGIGEAFVLSSVAATGDFGASPWQTLRYTAGVRGTYTIGFAIVDDFLIDDGMSAGLSRLYVDGAGSAPDPTKLQVIAERSDALGGRFELLAPRPEEPAAEGRLVAGFESVIHPLERLGSVTTAGRFTEPDGCRSAYAPTEGAGMAVLTAWGGTRPQLEAFLGLAKPKDALTALPIDVDGSNPVSGAATRLKVAVEAGDRVSFDWMFDAGDRLPDNDFAVFTVIGSDGSLVFKLADVRATGDAGATGWRTSVYTATGDEELTIGFAVVNDRIAGTADDPANSRLLVDNVWLNRDFGGGYQLADLAEPGDLATLPTG